MSLRIDARFLAGQRFVNIVRGFLMHNSKPAPLDCQHTAGSHTPGIGRIDGEGDGVDESIDTFSARHITPQADRLCTPTYIPYAVVVALDAALAQAVRLKTGAGIAGPDPPPAPWYFLDLARLTCGPQKQSTLYSGF
ncbi:hypothetical protein PG997_012381 [Apiospora hydei]|uniref:Uncharacterized protein n=1 Tax=Apiospora hydei TaxID=1337664 RepID=A0ABR1V374_9PEZI